MSKPLINRVIFLVETFFSCRDYQRFGVDILKRNGFQVEVWDASIFLSNGISAVPKEAEELAVCYLGSMEGLLKKVRQLKETDFVVNNLSYRLKTFPAYYGLSSTGSEYAVFLANLLPGVAKRSVWSKLKNWRILRSLFNFNKIKEMIFLRIPFSWLKVKPARLILAGGANSLDLSYPFDRKAEILWLHSLDYDIYRQQRNAIHQERRVAVFLDEYLPFHPDWQANIGEPAPIEAGVYYGLLDRLFSEVESALGLEVVIAAHPRSRYDLHSDFFKGRHCVSGQTCALVRQAQLVISHASTALSFANLFYKPVLFATTRELDVSWEGQLIRSMSAWFGKTPVFIDKTLSINWGDQRSVDKGQYDAYRNAYIKRIGSKDVFFWEEISSRLKEPV